MLNDKELAMSKFDAVDKMERLVSKLEFLTDSICNWDSTMLDFNEKHRSGFGDIMDEIIKDIQDSTEILKKEVFLKE